MKTFASQHCTNIYSHFFRTLDAQARHTKRAATSTPENRMAPARVIFAGARLSTAPQEGAREEPSKSIKLTPHAEFAPRVLFVARVSSISASLFLPFTCSRTHSPIPPLYKRRGGGQQRHAVRKRIIFQ